jgi:hypothetical protein
MAKRINLPTNSWNLTKLVFDELMAKSGLINQVNVMRSSLIMHAHTTISSKPKTKINGE